MTGIKGNLGLRLCCVYIYGAWIDARTLHNELGVKKKFADWIKTRIDKYEFIENDDYKLDFPKRGNQTSHGGDRKSLYYSLTLDWKLTVAKTGKRKNVKVNDCSLTVVIGN